MTLTLIEQLTAAKNLELLWDGLIPGTVLEPGQCLRWAAMGPEVAAYAINRASRKVQRMVQMGTQMTADDVARYVTSVIRNELSGTHEFSSPLPTYQAARDTAQEVVTP